MALEVPRAPVGPSRAPDGPVRRLGPPYMVKEYEYCSPHDGNGIVYSLGLDKGGGAWNNPVDTKALRVCASSLQGGNLSCTVDHDLNGVLFQSDDQPFSWVIFDFQECSVRPNYYTIAHRSAVYAFFMRSWQLEGSSDNSVWQILSRHNHDESLNPNSLVAAWALHAKAFYRYIRIVLDPNGNNEGGHALLFNCFDIYGEFKTPTGTSPTPIVQAGGGAYPMGVASKVPDYGGRHHHHQQGPGGKGQFSDAPERGGKGSDHKGKGKGKGKGADGGKRNQPRKRGLEAEEDLQRQDNFDLQNVAQINIIDLRGGILEHCQHQDGSRQVQARLSSEQCSAEEKQLLHDEILPSVVKLMTNKFGNYVVQKLIEHGSPQQRKSLAQAMENSILSLASQLYGCFVLQTALEVFEESERSMIANELQNHVLECIDHHHANHVLRKCVEVLPYERVSFVIANLEGNAEEVAKHVYGCRLLQLILTKYKKETDRVQSLIDELVRAVGDLACDTYGNYVVQHLVVNGDAYYKYNVHQQLLGNLGGLLQHQAASHVVEKMYEHGTKEERSAMLDRLLMDLAPQLPLLMNDKYANHVLQRMIDFSDAEQQQQLKDGMLPHADILNPHEAHGKYLLLRLQGKWHAGNPWQGKKGRGKGSSDDSRAPKRHRVQGGPIQ
uniref:PUM-HD domain-containing protein n=1 Tax=Eutreptiella gymnastica TaxID=73025 RepID=A0A7S1IZ30_9EUGL